MATTETQSELLVNDGIGQPVKVGGITGLCIDKDTRILCLDIIQCQEDNGQRILTEKRASQQPAEFRITTPQGILDFVGKVISFPDFAWYIRGTARIMVNWHGHN